MAEVTWFYTVVTFALAYTTGTLGIEKTVVLDAIICGAFVSFFTMPLFGILGDRIGHKWVFMIGTIGIGLFSMYFFRSEEHTSELQSLMRISYDVFCLKKKK